MVSAAGFLALALCVVGVGAAGLAAEAWTRFRQVALAEVLLRLLQYAVVPTFGLAVGAAGAASWAKEGAANATAATAATQAIMKRMNFSWAAIREGDGAASIVRKCY